MATGPATEKKLLCVRRIFSRAILPSLHSHRGLLFGFELSRKLWKHLLWDVRILEGTNNVIHELDVFHRFPSLNRLGSSILLLLPLVTLGSNPAWIKEVRVLLLLLGAFFSRNGSVWMDTYNSLLLVKD